MLRSVLLGFVLATATLAASATSLINVVVSNPTERTIKISYEENAVTGKLRIFKINLREDNTASFELSLPTATELRMSYGEVTVPLYVRADDELLIEMDGSAGLETIKFTGGSEVDNAFLSAYAKTFPEGQREELGGGFLPFMVEREVLAEAALADLDAFTKHLYAGLDARTNFIARESDGVAAPLIEHYKLRNTYRTELNKSAYLIQNQALLSPSELKAAAVRLGLADPNEEKDRTLLENVDFKEYLKAYAQYVALPNNGGHSERNGDALFAAVQEQVERPWRHYLQSEILVNAFDYLGNPEFGLDRYIAMKRDGVSQVYRERVENAYGDVLNLSPESLAPNIGMYTTDGSPISLTDLSGKVVYISFWASWCKPCLINFKKYDDIRSQLAAKGVTLLNVSIDDSEFAWTNSVEKENPRGVNTRATDIDGVKRSYNLSSIPAYYIIDKEGKIAVLPEGENRDLLASFDEILER